jgi:subtilisin family serine protease
MAEQGRSLPGQRIRVTIRCEVPVGRPADEEIRRLYDSWSRELAVEIDPAYPPVLITAPRAERKALLEENLQLVVVRAWVDPRHLAALKTQPHVRHVTRSARLEPFGRVAPGLAERAALARIDCGDDPTPNGTAAGVAEYLGVTEIWRAGYTGRGLVVGVVDGGITAHGRPTAFGGWPAIPQSPALGRVIGGWPVNSWGTTAEGWGQHGNMIAFDVQAMAPEADLWDIRIHEPGVPFEEYVNNAVEGYQFVIDHYQAHGFPQVLVNSWGVYDSQRGPDYAFDPGSDFTSRVEAALEAGILVLFAAGNCGDGCSPAAGTLCGAGDRGPGASILGPNGHPEVMTVGAATLRGEWCGYTSQGPAVLPPHDPDKPDFCAISQFEGFFPNESGLRPFDGGTSAATGIAAGVVALLKQARPDLTQDECRQVLRETARPIRTPAARDGAGGGIIDALRALRSL